MQYNSLSNQADINCSTCSYKDQVYYEVNKNLLTLMLWNFYIPYVDTNGKEGNNKHLRNIWLSHIISKEWSLAKDFGTWTIS